MMFPLNNVIKRDEEIIELKYIDESSIAYSTKSQGIVIVNINKHKQMLNLKTNTQKSSFFLFDLSHNKKRLAYVSDGYIYVLDTTFEDDEKYFRSAKVIIKIAINYKATVMKFDPTSNFILVGTEDNIVYQYRYNSLYIISKYHLFDNSKKRTKGISALTFDEDILYISGNRGDLVAVNIYSKIAKNLFTKESTSINEILLQGKEKLLTVHANGDLRIVSLQEPKKYELLDTIFTHINQIIYMTNKKYILACGDSPYISLIDIENKKVLAARYMYFDDDVKSMLLVSEYVLIVLLVNNTIVRVDIPTPRDLQSHILHNSLNEAYDLVKKEPMLLESDEYKSLESRYQELIKRVISEIPNQNKAYAQQTISFFEGVRSKRDEITLILRAFDSYQQFQNYFYQQEYATAYNLADRFPALKSTREYIKMESIFKQTFQKVQEYLLKGKKAEAHSLLREYMTAASKKAMIRLFLNHEQEFLKYLDVIKSKDVVQLKLIAQDDPAFSKYLEYLNIDLEDNKLNKSLVVLKKYLDNGEMKKAQTLLNRLDTKENVISLKSYKAQLNVTEELYDAYRAKDYHKCYELIDAYDFLQRNKLTQFLERHWKKLLLNAQKYALNGDVKIVQHSFSNFKDLKRRQEKMNEMIKLAFYVEIVSLLELKSYNIAKTFIDDYISLYDYDEMLKPLIERFNIAAEEQIVSPDTVLKKNILKKLKFLK